MVLFVFNIVVLIIFALAMVVAAFGFVQTKDRLFLFEALLVACFLLDTFIIFAAEFLFNTYPNVGPEYNFISAPEVKIVFFVIRQLAYLLVAKELFGLELPKWLYGIFPLLFLLYWNIYAQVAVSDSRFPAWVFYTVMQAYLLVLIIFCSRTERARESSNLKRLLRISLVFLALIVAFDLVWLFDLNEFNPFIAIMGIAYENNLFETALHVMYCIFIIESVLKRLDERLKEREQQSSALSEEGVEAAVKDLRLTKREEEVFRLLLEDCSYQEICDTLVVSMSTVKSHAHNIYDKAGCSRRSDLRRLVSSRSHS